MQINFTIADPEPIDVEITRNWFTGSFKCTANGRSHEIKSPFALGTHFAVQTTHNYTVQIDKHIVEIEHTRPRLAGGIRPNRYIVKVDGEVVADETGY